MLLPVTFPEENLYRFALLFVIENEKGSHNEAALTISLCGYLSFDCLAKSNIWSVPGIVSG